MSPQSTPVQVVGLSSYKILSVSAGFAHSCAVTDNGILLCWGNNSMGELGIGSTSKKIKEMDNMILPPLFAYNCVFVYFMKYLLFSL